MEDDTPNLGSTDQAPWHAELPSMRALAQILAKQAAREWLQSHEAANDNETNSPNPTDEV